ncbi:MAG: hypothetical protein N3G76_01400 [Candidatus Micrarchaeota archaeon]|nr:hypothetical protein [Candidatus Micrarchaeota archaeon]
MLKREEVKCWLEKRRHIWKKAVAGSLMVATIMAAEPVIGYCKEGNKMGAQATVGGKQGEKQTEAILFKADQVHADCHSVLWAMNVAINKPNLTDKENAAKALKGLVSRYDNKIVLMGIENLKDEGYIDNKQYESLKKIAESIDYERIYSNATESESRNVGGKKEKFDVIRDSAKMLDTEIRDVVCFVYLVGIINTPKMRNSPAPEKKLAFTFEGTSDKKGKKAEEDIASIQSVYNDIISKAFSPKEVNVGVTYGKWAYMLGSPYEPLQLTFWWDPTASMAARISVSPIGQVKLLSDAQVNFFSKEANDRIERIGNNYYMNGDWLYKTDEGRKLLVEYFRNAGKWSIGGIKSTDPDAAEKLFKLVEEKAGRDGYQKTMEWLNENYKRGGITNEQLQMIQPLVKIIDEIREQVKKIAYETTQNVLTLYSGFEKRFELKPVAGSQTAITAGGGVIYSAFELYDEKEKTYIGTIYVRGEMQWSKYGGASLQLQLFEDFGLMDEYKKNPVEAGAIGLTGNLSLQLGRRFALESALGGQASQYAQSLYVEKGFKWYPKGKFLRSFEIGGKGSITDISVSKVLTSQGFEEWFAGKMKNVVPHHMLAGGPYAEITFGGEKIYGTLNIYGGYKTLLTPGFEMIPEGGTFFCVGNADIRLQISDDLVITVNVGISK